MANPITDGRITRAMSDYLVAFDSRFAPRKINPSNEVCRVEDVLARMKEAERRMGLQIDAVFQERWHQAPRDLAVRVQMLEMQQAVVGQFNMAEPETIDDIRETARKAFEKSKSFLNSAKGAADGARQTSTSVWRVFDEDDDKGQQSSPKSGSGEKPIRPK